MSLGFDLLLVATIAGEFFLPWVLAQFCPGYGGGKMPMSALGNPKSPVRRVYNFWLLRLASLGVFAVGAGLLAGVFFVCFVMADKPEFQHTPLAREGLWQRLTLFFMYVPLLCRALAGLYA